MHFQVAILLQNSDYEIEHFPGKRISNVDVMSRCSSRLILEANIFEHSLSIRRNKNKKIFKIQNKLDNVKDKSFKLRGDFILNYFSNYLVDFKFKIKKLLFYVPKNMESNVIRTCHDNFRHIGIDIKSSTT